MTENKWSKGTFVWAFCEMLANENAEYGCDDEWAYRVSGGVLEYAVGNEGQDAECRDWSPACIAPRETSSLAWHRLPAAPQDGRDWLRSLEDGSKINHPHFGHCTKQGRTVWLDYIERAWPIDEVPDSGWSLRPQPAPGSRDAVAQSPEGTCWWLAGPCDSYWKRISGGMVQEIETLTGKVLETQKICATSGWSPILSLSGQPAEPVPYSPEWARVVCCDLHKSVRAEGFDVSSHVSLDGDKLKIHWKDGSNPWVTTDAIFNGYPKWSLYVAPVPTLEELAARVARLEGRVG